MKKLTLNYVCFALSALCLLLMSCKDDDVPYPAGKKIVNYEITLIHLEADAPIPSSLPKDCIVYRDHEVNGVVMDNYITLSFFYEGNKYPIRGLSVSDIRILNTDNSPVKALLSGEFFFERYSPGAILHGNSRSEEDNNEVTFVASSIVPKQ